MKLFKALMAIVLFAGVVLADSYTIPKDNNNQYPGNANLVGVTSKYSTTYTTVCVTSVSALVYGVTLKTSLGCVSTAYMVIYDTNSAKANNDFSATIYDKFRVTSDLTFSSATVNTTKVQRKEINFDPPIICNDGVYVAFPGELGTISDEVQWTVHYRNRNKGN